MAIRTTTRVALGRTARVTAALALLVVGRASAGALLSDEQLLAAAADGGVAVVDNALDGDVVVSAWLSPTPTLPMGTLRGLCVPDRKLLEQWKATHPQHPGRGVWDAVLQAGTTSQIVFLSGQSGALVPVCETEVMSGETFSASPAFSARRAALAARFASRAAPSVPAAPSSAPPAPTTTPPPAAPASGGCW